MSRQPLLTPPGDASSPTLHTLLASPLSAATAVSARVSDFFTTSPTTPRRSPRASPPSLHLVSSPFFARPHTERLAPLREFIMLASSRHDLEGRAEAAVVNVLDASREFLRSGAGGELGGRLAASLGVAAEAEPTELLQGLLDTAEAVRSRTRDEARRKVMEAALADAVRRMESETADGFAFPHRDFSAGLQLLPETALQYRMALAEWFIAMDALSFGVLGALLLGSVRHTRVFLSQEASEPVRSSRGGAPRRLEYTAFRSVLAPCASFDKAFDSRAYVRCARARAPVPSSHLLT